MRVLTIIPARGGSKGVPGKNCLPVYGKPLLAWTIECALRTVELGRIIVSSDDPKALEIAKTYSRVETFVRPARLAADTTPITDVIEHLLHAIGEEEGAQYDAILLLQPTAPLREPRHISGALEALAAGVNSVISVVAMHDTHPARMYTLSDSCLLSPIMPQNELARRQDIPPVYYRNGSIYLARTDAFLSQRSMMAKPAAGYEMEEKLLLNIDEPRDMIIAEPLVAAWQEGRL